MRLIDADALWHNMEAADWYNNADRDEVAEPLVLRSPTIGGWISVKDRMPPELHSMWFPLYGTPKWRNNAMWREESDHVLVAITFEDGSRFVTSGYTQDGKWSTGISKMLQYTVTHWMPLPEPPKEVKQND